MGKVCAIVQTYAEEITVVTGNAVCNRLMETGSCHKRAPRLKDVTGWMPLGFHKRH